MAETSRRLEGVLFLLAEEGTVHGDLGHHDPDPDHIRSRRREKEEEVEVVADTEGILDLALLRSLRRSRSFSSDRGGRGRYRRRSPSRSYSRSPSRSPGGVTRGGGRVSSRSRSRSRSASLDTRGSVAPAVDGAAAVGRSHSHTPDL